MKTKNPPCITLTDLAFPVTVKQDSRRRFSVIYGLQEKHGLSYSAAAKEFGLCVFHALACDGKLDNSD